MSRKSNRKPKFKRYTSDEYRPANVGHTDAMRARVVREKMDLPGETTVCYLTLVTIPVFLEEVDVMRSEGWKHGGQVFECHQKCPLCLCYGRVTIAYRTVVDEWSHTPPRWRDFNLCAQCFTVEEEFHFTSHKTLQSPPASA